MYDSQKQWLASYFASLPLEPRISERKKLTFPPLLINIIQTKEQTFNQANPYPCSLDIHVVVYTNPYHRSHRKCNQLTVLETITCRLFTKDDIKHLLTVILSNICIFDLALRFISRPKACQWAPVYQAYWQSFSWINWRDPLLHLTPSHQPLQMLRRWHLSPSYKRKPSR